MDEMNQKPQTIPKRERREYVTRSRRPAIVKFLSALCAAAIRTMLPAVTASISGTG